MIDLEQVKKAHLEGRHFSWSACPWCWAESKMREIFNATTISCVILALLLSVVVAQAEPSQRIGGDAVPDCLMWVDKDSGIQHEGHGCSLYLQTPGCYLKMQEAMRNLDPLLKITLGELARNKELQEKIYKPTMRLWESTMRECVK